MSYDVWHQRDDLAREVDLLRAENERLRDTIAAGGPSDQEARELLIEAHNDVQRILRRYSDVVVETMQLRSENERLREALRRLANDDYPVDVRPSAVARAALAKASTEGPGVLGAITRAANDADDPATYGPGGEARDEYPMGGDQG